MSALLRRLYYRLRPPPEDPGLIGRRVRRLRVNGQWKYNQDEGVVVGSFVDADRRLYQIRMDDHVVSCPLPDEAFEITNERVTSDELGKPVDLPEVRRSRDGNWWNVGSGYADYLPVVSGSPRWVRRQMVTTWRTLRLAYYRRWPVSENPDWIGRRVRYVGPERTGMIPGMEGVILSSEPYQDQRSYHIQFQTADCYGPLPSPEFELLT